MRKMRKMHKTCKVEKNLNEIEYYYEIIRITFLPEDSSKEKVLKTITHLNLFEARRIAVNILHEEMEWLEGKYKVPAHFYYEESKGLGYAIVLNLRNTKRPKDIKTVEGSYKDEEFRSGRFSERGTFKSLNLEYPRQDELEQIPSYSLNMDNFSWHYQVRIIENGNELEVDFKAENGYRAGFEAKNFCLGRKLAQEDTKDITAEIDLLMVGTSPRYKKQWKKSLLEVECAMNISMWEYQAFEFSKSLPSELVAREREIMILLRGNKDNEY